MENGTIKVAADAPVEKQVDSEEPEERLHPIFRMLLYPFRPNWREEMGRDGDKVETKEEK